MTVTWKEPAVPQHVVQMLVVDKYKRLLLMHRSEKVRSAPDCWSFPSGMHDIGETVWQTACRELREEYQLHGLGYELVGQYENIAGDDPLREQYHWVITMLAVVVDDLSAAVNAEPEKHDEFRVLPLTQLMNGVIGLSAYNFHSSFEAYARGHAQEMLGKCARLIARWEETSTGA